MDDNKDELGYKPQVQEIDKAKKAANDISSRVLDWLNIEGKLTESGARVSICEALDPDLEEYYGILHSWSIYDLKSGTFEEGMQNLRGALQNHDWKITKDGKSKTKAADPEIVAEHPRSHHNLHIIFERSIRGSKPMIGVRVNSRCYKAPEGTDISDER